MGKNHYGTATGKTFRLSVCLKRFFSDERARCYIKADTGLRFRWLVARMRRLFGLRGPVCLVARGHLLPPDEPVGLLSADDLVEVIPKEDKIFPDTSESEESEIENDIFGDDNEKPESTVPVETLAKHVVKENQPCHDKKSNATATCQCNVTAIAESSLRRSQEITQNVENNELIGNLELESEKLEEVKRKALELLEQCSIPPKRKRKRVRRRKQCSVIQESEDNSADAEDVTDGPRKPSTSDSGKITVGGNDVPQLSPSSPHKDILILRNNTEHSRAARLVHSMF